MKDDSKNVIPQTIEAVKNAFPKTVDKVDDGLSTIFGFFTDSLLAPVKILNSTIQTKVEIFQYEMRKKVELIKDPLKYADISIVGPILEDLKYRIDKDEIRDMYENLIISTIDTSKADYVHPAFVEFIKQMDKNDAILVSLLKDRTETPIVSLKVVSDINGSFEVLMPDINPNLIKHFSHLEEYYVSISNLLRLQIIEIPVGVCIDDHTEYESFKTDNIFSDCIKKHPKDITSHFSYDEGMICLTELGKRFIETCIREKE